MHTQSIKFIFLFLTCCIFSSCSHHTNALTSIQITDQNGLKETFSSSERLDLYRDTNFLSPQPHSQILRVYKPENQADTESFLTSYYPNGQIQKYLEIKNTQAHGVYKEWYFTGASKVTAKVIGGSPDFSSNSEASWLFDGPCKAWDQEGNLLAEIEYRNGRLEGESQTFHTNGLTWKLSNYENGLLKGKEKVYLTNGELLSEQAFSRGLAHGPARRFWPNKKLAANEFFKEGKLIQSEYFSPRGKRIAHVTQGSGHQAKFRRESLYLIQEVKNGTACGEVKVFNKRNTISRKYFQNEGVRDGLEVIYYPSGQERISFQWKRGKISGLVKTWYPSGVLESQREMDGNKKSGILSAWYRDGSTMLVEKYHLNNLLEGEYFRLGNLTPTSSIRGGAGMVTLFDSDGTFLREVIYQGGEPLSE